MSNDHLSLIIVFITGDIYQTTLKRTLPLLDLFINQIECCVQLADLVGIRTSVHGGKCKKKIVIYKLGFLYLLKMGSVQSYGAVYTKRQKDQRCRSRKRLY